MDSSFRDPSGFVFRREGVLYRHVAPVYRDHYERLVQSGLCAALTGDGLLIPHEEAPLSAADAGAFRLLKPEPVAFISYPYEWCFSQLKDAALTTLLIQGRALELGMTLKDASAYNIQFHHGRPILIDTLSFENHVEGKPWAAYRQFCQHFLAPLALMARTDVRLGQLSRIHIDGIPLDLASRLLPWVTRLNFTLMTHIHLHARFQSRYAGQEAAAAPRPPASVSRQGLLGLLDSLRSLVEGLRWTPPRTEWGDYYRGTNYSDAAFDAKRRLVADYLDRSGAATVWDLGSNNGLFSRIAAEQGKEVVSIDADPAAVESNYLECKKEKARRILPLLIDLTNPSPDLGWRNREREALLGRGGAGVAMALALIHHLAISNNVPLESIAGFFAGIAPMLIVEFVPKSDSQVRRLLASREDVFPDYTREGFERAFAGTFAVLESAPIEGSDRTLYRMQRRDR